MRPHVQPVLRPSCALWILEHSSAKLSKWVQRKKVSPRKCHLHCSFQHTMAILATKPRKGVPAAGLTRQGQGNMEISSNRAWITKIRRWVFVGSRGDRSNRER